MGLIFFDLMLSGLSTSTPARSRCEYGPAVAGRAVNVATSGLRRVGRMGATDIPPALTDRVDSGRPLEPVDFVDVVECDERFEVVLVGEEICAMAEPGLAGSLFVVNAFF